MRLLLRSCGGVVRRSFQMRIFSGMRDGVQELERVVQASMRKEKVNELQMRHNEISKLLEDNNFWDDSEKATKLTLELSNVASVLEYYEGVNGKLSEVNELSSLAEEERDEELQDECEDILDQIRNDLKRRQVRAEMTSEVDKGGCYLEIISGVGGADAFHWTKMLATMYANWAKNNGYTVTYVDEQHDDTAGSVSGQGGGYRRVTLRVEGDCAYGWLKAEAGVHRLVRNSPFDPTGKRHTSFSQVQLYPQTCEDDLTKAQLEIRTIDLKIDTYKSRGAGGQSVNTTDSAVRITHIPTNIVVTCQNERSQHQNKAMALKVLQAKLWQNHLENMEKSKQESTIGQGDNSWGKQIRSVVIHPYRLVKDNRSGWETSDVEGHLAGKLLTEAIEAFHLRERRP